MSDCIYLYLHSALLRRRQAPQSPGYPAQIVPKNLLAEDQARYPPWRSRFISKCPTPSDPAYHPPRPSTPSPSVSHLKVVPSPHSYLQNSPLLSQLYHLRLSQQQHRPTAHRHLHRHYPFSSSHPGINGPHRKKELRRGMRYIGVRMACNGSELMSMMRSGRRR